MRVEGQGVRGGALMSHRGLSKEAPGREPRPGADTPGAYRRPGYSSAGCFPAEPASASPGRGIAADRELFWQAWGIGEMPQKIHLTTFMVSVWPGPHSSRGASCGARGRVGSGTGSGGGARSLCDSLRDCDWRSRRLCDRARVVGRCDGGLERLGVLTREPDGGTELRT